MTDMTTTHSLVIGHARIVRQAAKAAVAEYRHTHTWRTWVFGWLGRMLSQVTFFALVGRLLGSEASVRYLVVGNAVMVCVVETMMVVSAGVRERYDGTLAALAATPAAWGTLLFGRGLYAPVGGALTSSVSLLLLAPVFGVRTVWSQVPVLILLILLTAMSTYGIGLVLSALVIATPGARNILSNSCNLTMMAICGVQVPVGFWPEWVQWVAAALPLTHSLAAVRTLVAGGAATAVAASAAVALLTGLLWQVLAYLTVTAVRRRGRRKGTFGHGG